MFFLDRGFVKAGASLLDRIRPDWFLDVDTRRLDMSDERECVIAQLYGSFTSGLAALRIGHWEARRFGIHSMLEWKWARAFAYRALTRAWVLEIDFRRAAAGSPLFFISAAFAGFGYEPRCIDYL